MSSGIHAAGHTPTAITIRPDATSGQGQATGKDSDFFGADGFSFGDLIDIINPLQHIPIVSNIYRAVTGDTISPGASIIGGGVFGGALGAVASIANEIVTQVSGKSITDNVASIFEGDEQSTADNSGDDSSAAEAAVTQADNHIRTAANIPIGDIEALTPETSSTDATSNYAATQLLNTFDPASVMPWGKEDSEKRMKSAVQELASW